MTYFRPGGRNTTILMRPMVELQEDTGFKTGRKLIRWGARNSLANDFHVKRPHRHARWKYHEPQWVQRKRWVREYMTRRWKREVKNTAEMALWWKFRVNAKDSWDIEQYESYLQQREDKRLKELMKENQYNSWSVKDCIQDTDYIKYTKSDVEKFYMDSMKPEVFLEGLRTRFISNQTGKAEGYDLWKNKLDEQVMERTEYKKLNNNQNIKIQGMNDIKGYDWIKFNQSKDNQALLIMNDDPEYLYKMDLVQQNKADKALLNDILNEK